MTPCKYKLWFTVYTLLASSARLSWGWPDYTKLIGFAASVQKLLCIFIVSHIVLFVNYDCVKIES